MGLVDATLEFQVPNNFGQYLVLQKGQKLSTKIPKVLRKENNQVEITFHTSKL